MELLLWMLLLVHVVLTCTCGSLSPALPVEEEIWVSYMKCVLLLCIYKKMTFNKVTYVLNTNV